MSETRIYEHSGDQGGTWHVFELNERSPVAIELAALKPMDVFDDGLGNLYRWQPGPEATLSDRARTICRAVAQRQLRAAGRRPTSWGYIAESLTTKGKAGRRIAMVLARQNEAHNAREISFWETIVARYTEEGRPA